MLYRIKRPIKETSVREMRNLRFEFWGEVWRGQPLRRVNVQVQVNVQLFNLGSEAPCAQNIREIEGRT